MMEVSSATAFNADQPGEIVFAVQYRRYAVDRSSLGTTDRQPPFGQADKATLAQQILALLSGEREPAEGVGEWARM